MTKHVQDATGSARARSVTGRVPGRAASLSADVVNMPTIRRTGLPKRQEAQKVLRDEVRKACGDEALWNGQQVSEFFQVSPLTVERWRYEGTGPRWHKVGRHVRYKPSDVYGWLDAQAQEPRDNSPRAVAGFSPRRG
jgi:hypothetical protein